MEGWKGMVLRQSNCCSQRGGKSKGLSVRVPMRWDREESCSGSEVRGEGLLCDWG
jgi:hypothetical protein